VTVSGPRCENELNLNPIVTNTTKPRRGKVVLQAAYERALWGVDSLEISLIYAILIQQGLPHWFCCISEIGSRKGEETVWANLANFVRSTCHG
jgi:hypothetical protein